MKNILVFLSLLLSTLSYSQSLTSMYPQEQVDYVDNTISNFFGKVFAFALPSEPQMKMGEFGGVIYLTGDVQHEIVSFFKDNTNSVFYLSEDLESMWLLRFIDGDIITYYTFEDYEEDDYLNYTLCIAEYLPENNTTRMTFQGLSTQVFESDEGILTSGRKMGQIMFETAEAEP